MVKATRKQQTRGKSVARGSVKKPQGSIHKSGKSKPKVSGTKPIDYSNTYGGYGNAST